MKNKLILFMVFVVLICSIGASAQQEKELEIAVNGTVLEFEKKPVLLDGTTLIPIRPLAEEMGFVVVWLAEEQTVSLWNETIMLRLKIGSNEMTVNDEVINLLRAPEIIDDSTYLPLRAVAEAFGAEVSWQDNVVDIRYEKPEAEAVVTEEISDPKLDAVSEDGFYFYSQRDGKWGLGSGNGYCWVCSYAMLISNVKGEAVTPADVAAFNAEGGGSGSYMRSHVGIVERFGVSFSPALSEESPYFREYQSWRGATYLNVSSDEDTVKALKEALDRNPKGVIVRYEGYPHSMVAVGYEGDTIFFNESAYTDSIRVPFEETCLKYYDLADISFIQAIVA